MKATSTSNGTKSGKGKRKGMLMTTLEGTVTVWWMPRRKQMSKGFATSILTRSAMDLLKATMMLSARWRTNRKQRVIVMTLSMEKSKLTAKPKRKRMVIHSSMSTRRTTAIWNDSMIGTSRGNAID